VDEVEESGPPDKIQIRARSADFTGPPASAA
jgi:phage protein D